MNKFLVLAICILFSTPAFAENVVSSENTSEAAETTVQESTVKNSEELLKEIDEQNLTDEAKQPEIEIIHKVEHKIIPLPECDNPLLSEKTKEFLNTYFEKLSSLGTLYRRQQYFVLHSLDKFEKEDISAYKTAEKQVIANAIANAEVNFSLTDDNLRLCKNTSQNKYAKDTYLLIFPKDNGYIVQILNLMDRQEKDDLDISFFYEDENLNPKE